MVRHFLFGVIVTLALPLKAQQVCDPLGNVMVYSNYEGGYLTIDVDQNIPNLKIGVTTYEAVQVDITGAFAGNITAVLFAGFGDINNGGCGPNIPGVTINGAPPGTVTVMSTTTGNIPIATYLDDMLIGGVPLVNCITSGGGCSQSTGGGGGNSSPQIVDFFLSEFGPGSVLFGHWTDYSCFPAAPFLVSNGGNCCLQTPSGDPNPIYQVGGGYNFFNDDTLLCGATLTLDVSGYPLLYQPPIYTGYVWSDGSTGNTFTITQPGTYWFTATDYCHYDITNNYLSDTIVVLPCCSLDLAWQVDSITCNGSMDGALEVLNLGLSPLTYLWNTVPVQTTATVTGLGPGLYSVLVSDTAGCDTTLTFQLTDPAPFDVVINGVTTFCAGSSSTLSASVSGGAGSASFVWSTGAQSTTIVVDSAATYVVVATDTAGCTATDSIAVVVQPCCSLSLALQVDSITCNGAANGASEVINLGLGPFTYLWNTVPVQTTAAVTGLGPGLYSVLVSDTAGCDTTLTFQLTDPPPFDVIINGVSTVCTGSSTILSASVSGGAGNASFVWSTGAQSTTIVVDSAATYVVVATDTAGCTATDSVAVVVQPCCSLSLALQVDSITCNGAANGGSEVINLGLGPLTYLWNTVPVQTTAAVTGLGPGLYSVLVSDMAGCDTTLTFQLTDPPPFDVIINGVTTVCTGSSTTLSASVSGGAGNASFVWITGAQSTSIVVDSAANYAVFATDTAGCTATDSVEVVLLSAPEAAFTGPDTVCAGTSATFSNASIGADSLVWTLGTAGGSSAPSPSVTFQDDGQQVITLEAWNDAGCSDDTSLVVSVSQVAQADFTAIQVPCSTEVRLAIATTGADSCVLLWNTDVLAQGCDQELVYDLERAGAYTLTLIASNASGCNDTLTSVIELEEFELLFVPNAFTPNADGFNDRFPGPVPADTEGYSLTVFDRWGTAIFSSADPDLRWDGTAGGQVAPDGVYAYVLVARDGCGTGPKTRTTGHVVLLR